jgi:lysozyme
MSKPRSFAFKRIFKITAICLLVVAALVYHKQMVRYGYKAWRLQKRFFMKPPPEQGFNVEYPYGYSVHGIDVSRWQDVIDWKKLKTRTPDGDTLKFEFVFMKATEGILLEDPTFRDNWNDAKENKIIRGAYHYFLPHVDAKLQAKNFMSSVKLTKGDLPPVIDVEETGGKSKKELVKRVRIFALDIEKKYKVKPIIYSNISFIEDYLADDFDGYYFWIAHYYEEELVIEKSVNWLFWQHSDKAAMFGCRQLVDVNVFNGNKNELKAILLK